MSKRPVIAIVGRPNVGKSTLFNRLTGTRAALVSDLPGLTRDRREGKTSISGHKVTLVDTAGLEDARRDSIASRMRQQSETAITMADLILFVFDARAGVTPPDAAFAKIARQSGKPVILVANKSESRASEAGVLDAFSLGFGDPVAISAEHGDGLGDLADDILSALDLKPVPRSKRNTTEHADDGAPPEADSERPQPKGPIRIAVLGRPNAGKSTLVNTLIGEERMITGPEPGLTRDSISTDLDWGGRAVRIIDTAGLRRKARIDEKAEKLAASDAIRSLRTAEVIILLIDATHPLEHQDLILAEMALDEGRALVVAINKWDLIENKNAKLKDIQETLRESLAQAPGVPLVTLSALSSKGIDRLRQSVLEIYTVWNKRVATHKLNQWLNEALQRHAPPTAKGRRIKIRFMTQPSTRPPTFVAFCSQPTALPKAYMRYLSNSLRDAFQLPGVPIRINLRKGENPFARD